MFSRYFKLKKPKKRTVHRHDSSVIVKSRTDFGKKCSSSESDDLEDLYKEKTRFESSDYPDDYWNFQKTMKYLACGKPLITTLCFMNTLDYDYQNPIMLQALEDYKVVQVLLNVLRWNDKRLQTVSLRFLQKLSSIRTMRQKIVCLGGIEDLVALLRHFEFDIKQAVAEAITKIADYHKARKIVGSCGGIPLLAHMLYVPTKLLDEVDEPHHTEACAAVISAAEAAAEALFTVCSCKKNQEEFLNCGGLRGCQKILKTSHTKLAAMVMLIVQRCASQKRIKLAIKSLNMLEDFRSHFYSEDQRLMQAAAQAAYICAEGEDAKTFFEKEGFVDKLFEIIQRSAFHSDDKFMVAISGALWKSSENEVNAKRLVALNALPFFLQLLSSQSPKVQEHIVACLTCCMKSPQAKVTVRKNNGVEVLIGLLHTIHAPLIMHLNRALAIASSDAESLALMEKNNALRLMWSHLKNGDPSVVSNTAWQLTEVLKNTPHSSEHIRSLVGGVQLLTDLLRSENTRVLTPVCAMIVILSKEDDNQRLLTDYQVVKRLSDLTQTKCRRLRYHLCMAIRACCSYRRNRQDFAHRKIVFPLMKMLNSKCPVVTGAAAQALDELSLIPYWCAVMYNTKGVYQILIEQMKHKDQAVQQSAADIIQRMRLFALNRDGNVPDWMIEKHAPFFKN